MQPGRQQGGRSAAAVQQRWRHQLGPHCRDVFHRLHQTSVRNLGMNGAIKCPICCFSLDTAVVMFISLLPFSALSTTSFPWPLKHPLRGFAGGSLFTPGRAMTSGQLMMSLFCQRGRNTSSLWLIQLYHRSGFSPSASRSCSELILQFKLHQEILLCCSDRICQLH